MKRLPLRRRLVLAATGIALVTVLALSAGFLLLLRNALEHDADRALHERSQAAVSTVAVEDTEVRLLERDGDAGLRGNVWVYSAGKALERGAGSAPVQAQADALASSTEATTVELRDLHVVMRAVPVRDDKVQRATVVVAMSTRPYSATERSAVTAFSAMGAVLVLFVVVLAWLLARAALRPVAAMTVQAAEWSERDLEDRFDVPPVQDELTALAATLNGLLDRISAALGHERRFSAEVAHELRTPLAVMMSELEITLRRERDAAALRATLEAVSGQVARMASVVETLMATAEREPRPGRGSAELSDVLAAAVSGIAASPGISIYTEGPPGGVRVAVESAVAVQVLAPLLANASRHAMSRVIVVGTSSSTGASVWIGDDGPGWGVPDPEALFAPGVRGEHEQSSGAGLGLALSRRVATAIGGFVTAGDPAAAPPSVADMTGALLRVDLPTTGDPVGPQDR